MKENPQISVIIPTYNAEHYIDGCVSYIVAQTMKDWELIFVDDGSYDGTVAIIREYASKDERIKLIECEHRSAGAARNEGLAKAKGKYLAILDVDDVYYPDMFIKMWQQAEEGRADVVICLSGEFDENIGIKKSVVGWHLRTRLLPEKRVFSIKDFAINVSAFEAIMGWPWDKLFRSEYIKEKKIKFQDQKSINDLLFVYSALAGTERISVVKEKLVDKQIRKSGAITSEGGNFKSWKDVISALQALKEQLKKWEMEEAITKDYNKYVASYIKDQLGKLWNSPDFEGFMIELKKADILKNLEESDSILSRDDKIFINDIKNRLSEEIRWLYQTIGTKEHYLFPYELVKNGSRIALYAAGRVGVDFYQQIRRSGYCKIVHWVDRDYEMLPGGELEPIRVLKSHDYNQIVLAVADQHIAKDIIDELVSNGIDKNIIVWRSPNYP